ncbi:MULTISPECIES: alanine--glyoxylate aminotransferase family protein [unclassified Bacillus (in: firmicutes)]|uniref:pyridoxal-phosphate-dependent aminotransferase family protein n=1 Tax=unclassified Bacillus (in: firmicutes) TaxID=185979 RepID=UPI0008F2AC8B|nr:MULTISPECIES: alanine--glyoxylate aminotransferase family protein [unclassified Bacillus (in: firmicutes)]SFA71442.1 aspartate aminotransferase [Bacillus sp. UNCCL13]SFQ61640.1 aspartate aminotransferase [Bacillus sp. cl95]
MLIDQQYLFTPGPTPIPERVKYAMNRPMIGHRSQEFPLLLEEVATRLMPVFGSANPVTIISGSGTAALETAAANVIEEGDHVVVIVTGAFGDRFASICEAFGAEVHRLDIQWGRSCSPDELESFLKKINCKLKAVIATYCETSTGVLNPIQNLGKVVKDHSDALFIVDGVSCIGAIHVNMVGWDIDVVVAGSQKALMLPPGLAFVASSERAVVAFKECKAKRFYLDLNRYHSSYEKEKSTPFTPAVSLIYGALEVCNMLEEEGLENVILRHELLRNMVRRGLQALELPLLTSDTVASPTVTAFETRNPLIKQIKKSLQEDFAVSLAGGQGKLKGEIARIGHMGYCTPFDVLKVLSAFEMSLQKLQGNQVLGVATSKAQEVWIDHV